MLEPVAGSVGFEAVEGQRGADVAAQRHGGLVRCVAAPGGGAQFVLTLPLMA